MGQCMNTSRMCHLYNDVWRRIWRVRERERGGEVEGWGEAWRNQPTDICIMYPLPVLRFKLLLHYTVWLDSWSMVSLAICYAGRHWGCWSLLWASGLETPSESNHGFRAGRFCWWCVCEVNIPQEIGWRSVVRLVIFDMSKIRNSKLRTNTINRIGTSAVNMLPW